MLKGKWYNYTEPKTEEVGIHCRLRLSPISHNQLKESFDSNHGKPFRNSVHTRGYILSDHSGNSARRTPAGTPTEPPPSGLSNTDYTYDGDGNRLKSVIDGVTTYYPGGHYQKEVDSGVPTIRKYYSAAGQTVAVRTQVDTDPTRDPKN